MTDPTQPQLGRVRKTKPLVHVIDRVATGVISVGGLMVVVAVLGIFVYLTSVALVVFRPGAAGTPVDVRLDPAAAADVLFLQIDEHRSSAMVLSRAGVLRQIELATGRAALERSVIPEGAQVAAFVRGAREGDVAIGYADGRVQLGTIRFETDFLLDEASEQALASLKVQATTVHDGAVVTRTTLGQLRRSRVVVELPAPVRPGPEPEEGTPAPGVRAITSFRGSSSEYTGVVMGDGAAYFTEVRKVTPLGGGAPRLRLTPHDLTLAPRTGAGASAPPDGLFVTGDGASVIAYWSDGTAQRYDTTTPDDIVLVEQVALTAPGVALTATQPLLGSKTLIVGDERGNVSGWFCARDAATPNRDKLRLVRAHEFGPEGGAVRRVAISERNRTFLTADALGSISLRHMTSGREVVRLSAADLGDIAAIAIAPKSDGLAALSSTGVLRLWALDPAYPEASVGSVFGKVWYEGEPGPAHVYQSSSGDDSSEPKFGLTPLIVGTLKATLYTLLLAVPIGVLAALATSEFVDRRVRTTLKPMIEMMASLPSVVLGFVAAMFIAPLVVDWLPGVLLAFVVVPLGVLLGALLWQLLPMTLLLSISEARRGAVVALVTLASLAAAFAGGRLAERVLFSPGERDLLVLAGSTRDVPRERWPAWIGARTELTDQQKRELRREGLAWRDGKVVEATGSISDPDVVRAIERYRLDRPSLRRWLDGSFGSAWPGWAVIAFPGAVIVVFMAIGRVFPSIARALDIGTTQLSAGLAELIKFFAGVALAAAVAIGVAGSLTSLGLDPRDTIFGSFQQRNTLVVAIAMSVAVIPIIYTICEDSMSSVPDTLRSASLAAGATRWQTAVKVVLPVAMSGVFSAVMIGLGRAAGETMIVLMATGNTPIMSPSLFDGMRTLAANIAVELPEAAKGETHYRLLFLCGLVLFVITFVFNSLAEVVRQRVRKRSAQL